MSNNFRVLFIILFNNTKIYIYFFLLQREDYIPPRGQLYKFRANEPTFVSTIPLADFRFPLGHRIRYVARFLSSGGSLLESCASWIHGCFVNDDIISKRKGKQLALLLNRETGESIKRVYLYC